MVKHVFFLALAICVGVALSRIFGGTFNIAGLLSPSTTTTTTTCHVAAVVFGEDLEGPRVKRVRRWLVNDFAKSGRGEAALVAMYQQYGAWLAFKVRQSRALKAVATFVFNRALRHADAKYGVAA